MNLIFDLIRFGGQLPNWNLMHSIIYWFSQVIALLFFVLYFHQIVYVFVGSFFRHKLRKKEFVCHDIAFVVAARNESAVISNLIDSIRKNKYEKELKIFVVADNCTDNTAQICRDLGCVVFERNDLTKVGKGFALNFLFEKLHTDPQYANILPEAYIVVDADNILKSNFVEEINKYFDCGYEVVSSYRNTKNFGDNWISSGHGYCFLRESQHLNKARMVLGCSAVVAGTGFLISRNVVEQYGNWKFFTLTEDVEFSTDYVIDGEKIGYCEKAELFDEQPTSFRQSWRQRERWAKGYFQVMKKSGRALLGKIFTSFSCWDNFTCFSPAVLVTFLAMIGFPILAIVATCCGMFAEALFALESFLLFVLTMYVVMFLVGICLCVTEWKHIVCPGYKKILYLFTFPIFMITFAPIALCAVFKKPEWKPIAHKKDTSIDDLNKKTKATK